MAEGTESSEDGVVSDDGIREPDRDRYRAEYPTPS